MRIAVVTPEEPLLPPSSDEKFDALAKLEQACQVIVHAGVQYQVVGISEPDEHGNRQANLILFKPF